MELTEEQKARVKHVLERCLDELDDSGRVQDMMGAHQVIVTAALDASYPEEQP